MKTKIAIIGAGISGLSLGYYLSKKNIDVTIFEKENKVGGLLGGIEIEKDIEIEKFYHHIFPSDKEFLELFNELGLKEDMGWYKSSNSIFVDSKFLSFSKIGDYLKFPKLSVVEKVRLLVGGYIFSKKRLSSVEKLKAEYAIKKYMGKKSWDNIWGPLFTKKFGKDTKNILASWFWWRMNVKLGDKRKEILGYPKMGFSRFIKLLVNKISSSGGKIVNNTLVEEVLKTKDSYNINGSYFDKVIFTTPGVEVNKLYKKGVVKNIEYKSAINLILLLNRPQTNWYWNNVPDLSIPFVGIIEHTNLVGSSSYNNKAVLYFTQYIDKEESIYKMSNKEIFKEYKKYLKKIGIIEADIISFFVSKSRYAQPVLTKKPANIGFQKVENNMYKISMEDIYPEDRGINQAIKYAKNLANKIS